MQNTPAYDWNDLRHFLAVARTGSTLAAARLLKVNQTTTARRIEALETALGVQLFERRQRGYRLTEAGTEILAGAERVEGEAETLARLLEQRSRRLAGVVRVTTNEAFANMVLTPCLSDFAALYPHVRVEVTVSDRRLDVLRGEADVALRAGARPDEIGLVGKRLADIRWSVYCSRDYAARRGAPDRPEALSEHLVIGGADALANIPGMRWLERWAAGAEMLNRSNSLSNVMAAMKAGLGVSALPCMMGDRDPDLVRCMPPVTELDADLWLVVREPMKDLPHVRAFTQFVSARIAAVRHVLAARENMPNAVSE
jgi:DNA-binding transcriptional LysR family regulator